MNNEIKEILDKLKFTNNDVMWCDKITLNVEQSHLLLDYITNLEQVNKNQAKRNSRQRLANQKQYELILKLQQENERLKHQLNQEKPNYLQIWQLEDRIDKAIEYIEEHYPTSTINDQDDKYDLLNILQNGSDDNEC